MSDARRWRLLLGGGESDATGAKLNDRDQAIDRALGALYDPPPPGIGRRGGLGASAPSVARWLGEIRELFPSSVVQVMQRDAIERLDLQQLLLQPEMLASVQPDVHLVATILALKDLVPAKAKAAAREVVAQVVEEVKRRIEAPTREALSGSIRRAGIGRRPKPQDIDWHRTIRANMRNYLPAKKTIIPEKRIGLGRQRASLRDLFLCVDQSGSMARSVIYSGIFGAVLASLPALSVHLITFDTEVADLTEELGDDPVDLLFGVQLGGGTDIARALAYAQGKITRPEQSVLVLISDLAEGGDRRELEKRAASLVASGVKVIALLALDDDGAPAFDHQIAGAMAALGVPSFACTPDKFPGLISAAISGREIDEWAAAENVTITRADS